MPVTKNTTSEVVFQTSATGTMNIADGELPGQNVRSYDISEVYWSGQWAVTRGANTVLDLSGSGGWNLNATGMEISESGTAPLTATLTGAGTIIIKMKKEMQN